MAIVAIMQLIVGGLLLDPFLWRYLLM